MKNLTGHLNEYLSQLDGPSLIRLERFREDGINLSLNEGLVIGGFLYDGLLGYILMSANGVPEKVPVHPIIEAIYEAFTGALIMEMMGIYVPGSIGSKGYGVLLMKFEINPQDVLIEVGI